MWLNVADDFQLSTAIDRAEEQGTPVTDSQRFRMPGVRAPHGMRVCLAHRGLGGSLDRRLGKLAALLQRPLTLRTDIF